MGPAWAEVLNRRRGSRTRHAAEKWKQQRHTPIEEKESLRWLNGRREARDDSSGNA